MNEGRNPLVILVLNFLVGVLVSKGIIEASVHNEVVELLSQLVGLLIIGATTVVSLHKVFHHTNTLKKGVVPGISSPAPSTPPNSTTTTLTEQVSITTPTVPSSVLNDPGLPPMISHSDQTGTPPIEHSPTSMGSND